MTPRYAAGTIFAPLNSTLHNLRFDLQYDYGCTKWIWTLRGHTPWLCPQGSHQNSKCVPPVLIHRAITCDFKVLAKKAELGDNKKKDPKSYFLTSSDPQTCPLPPPPPLPQPHRGKIFAPLYSKFHNLRFDMQHGYVCIK